MMKFKNNPTNNGKKISSGNNQVEIVKLVLEFNQIDQEGSLKILTPNQMLSRLPISLAQLKAANNCENFKNEIRQIFLGILFTDQKNLQKMFIRV